MAAEYLLTSSIDPIKKGEQFVDGPLPRHVTLQQWFTLDHVPAFKNALQNLATTLEPVEIIGGENAEFGPNNDVPVRLVRNIGRVARLHTKTGELIERFGGELRNPEWAGDGYNPHVTYVDGAALDEGEAVTLRTIEMIKREDGVRTVEMVLGFSGNGRK